MGREGKGTRSNPSLVFFPVPVPGDLVEPSLKQANKNPR